MNQETEHVSKKTVVYTIPGMDVVNVRRDEPYLSTDEGALTMDLYYPPKKGGRLPAVVIVADFPDPGFRRILGCKFKEMGSSVSWGKLLAASGMVAIAYENREPASDLRRLLRHVREHAAPLEIDENRMGLWASSGNAPLALSALMDEGGGFLKCATLCYGFTLDLDGSTAIAEASKSWGFANPGAGKSVEDLPREVPLFLARAGQDSFPHLNEAAPGVPPFFAEGESVRARNSVLRWSLTFKARPPSWVPLTLRMAFCAAPGVL